MSSKAIEKLLALATEAERAAASYRLAAAALNGHAVDKRAARSAAVLDGALELDAARRGPKRKPAKPEPGAPTRAKLAARERTARVLAIIADKGPMTNAEITVANEGRRFGVAPLANAGYLKHVGDTYKRTAKPFVVDWRASS